MKRKRRHPRKVTHFRRPDQGRCPERASRAEGYVFRLGRTHAKRSSSRIASHESRLAGRHTMPSNFRCNSLNTRKRRSLRVTHFFTIGLPVSTPDRAPEATHDRAPRSTVSRAWEIRRAREIKRVWEISRHPACPPKLQRRRERASRAEGYVFRPGVFRQKNGALKQAREQGHDRAVPALRNDLPGAREFVRAR